MSPHSRRGFLRRAGSGLAGATLVGVVGASRVGEAGGGTPTAAPTETARESQTTPRVEFDAQRVEADGRRVAVELVVVPDGGFVSIREGGPAGPGVGFSDYLPPGRHRHVEVDLRARGRVTSRRELTALLHRDTDGDRAFDFPCCPDDGPYVVDGRAVYDTAVVFAPTPAPDPTPTRSRTQSPSPTPTASPSPSPTATEASDGIPGFGVVAGLVAAGAGALAARRRG